ncbi:hypothetical protein Ddye_027286 [Dipteronia dyeriana]|uniref:Reverse transcriptase domain-containing protein n=1 Tax=Dipteronia dyeriana TaxID=168575 RepID=A0AAD9TP08_9ROSI|nr:hypothetical protein Ddye_027286 [Dipteronia dyeriana]
MTSISSPVGIHAPSHFLYVGDVILFCQASPQNLQVILDAFTLYGSLSGQQVNWKKSSIFFGKGISGPRIANFLSMSWMHKDGDSMAYLGVPLFIGPLKRRWLIPWADKIKSKLESWKGFSLSMVGRLCLIDLVITGSIDGRKSVQVAWKSCCRLKDGGGLGVKDLGILNKVMLKKFTWKILTEESLVFTYLRAQFFTQDHKPRTWSSLQPPLDYIVGDIYSDAAGWNIPTSFKASYPYVAYEIENVVVSTDPDSLVWTCSLDGSVSCKSVYTSLSEVRSFVFWDYLQSGTMKNYVDELQIFQWLHVSGRPLKAPSILEGFFVHAGVFRTCRGFVKGCFAIPLGVCFAFEAELAAAVYAIDYT